MALQTHRVHLVRPRARALCECNNARAILRILQVGGSRTVAALAASRLEVGAGPGAKHTSVYGAGPVLGLDEVAGPADLLAQVVSGRLDRIAPGKASCPAEQPHSNDPGRTEARLLCDLSHNPLIISQI